MPATSDPKRDRDDLEWFSLRLPISSIQRLELFVRAENERTGGRITISEAVRRAVAAGLDALAPKVEP